MANLKILNHGTVYGENERFVYFSPVSLSTENNINSINIYNENGESQGDYNVVDIKISSDFTNSFIVSNTTTNGVTEFSFSDVTDRTFTFKVGSIENLNVNDVVYINTGVAHYDINKIPFIINSIDENVLTVEAHYDIKDDDVSNIKNETNVEGNLIKPLETLSIQDNNLYKISYAEVIDLKYQFEFFTTAISGSTNTFNGILVYSSELISSSNSITGDGIIYEFTDNGFLSSNEISITNNVVKYGSLKPSVIIDLVDNKIFSQNHRINIDTAVQYGSVTDGDINSGIYDGYIGNMLRMSEQIMRKGVSDLTMAMGLDYLNNLRMNETIDYSRIEEYIDSSISNVELNTVFDSLYVNDTLYIGSSISIFSNNNAIYFDTTEGVFGLKFDSSNFDSDRIVFDNDATVTFTDNVEINNVFELKYSATNESNTRENTLIESRMGFFKVMLSNNTSSNVVNDKIKYFYSIGSQTDVDNRILFSSYIWQNTDISSLGYCSHRNITNIKNFNNFISSKMTTVMVSQEAERVGIISQGETYVYGKESTSIGGKTLNIMADEVLTIDAKKMIYNVDELGFSVNNMSISNMVLQNLQVTGDVKSSNLDVSNIVNIGGKMIVNDDVNIDGKLIVDGKMIVKGTHIINNTTDGIDDIVTDRMYEIVVTETQTENNDTLSDPVFAITVKRYEE